MSKGLWLLKWKIALSTGLCGTALTAALVTNYVNGEVFDPSGISERSIQQNQILFPGEASAEEQETEEESQEQEETQESPTENGWEEEENESQAEGWEEQKQPQLFEEEEALENPSDTDLFVAEMEQSEERDEERKERFREERTQLLPENVVVLDRSGEANPAGSPVLLSRGEGGNPQTPRETQLESPKRIREEREELSSDGRFSDSSGSSSGGSGSGTTGEQPAATAAPEDVPVQPGIPSEPETPKRHESAKDVNAVGSIHTSDNYMARYMFNEFPENGKEVLDPKDLKIDVTKRSTELGEEYYRLVYGEEVTPEKIIMSSDIVVYVTGEGKPLAIWKENENVEFKDYPEIATGDFTVKCRVRANKESQWTDWTDVEVPVYDERIVIKVPKNGEWQEKSFFLKAGASDSDNSDTVSEISLLSKEVYSMLNLGAYLNGEYGIQGKMLGGWSEGYDYYEKVGDDYVLHDVIEKAYSEDFVKVEKNGGRRVFYANMVEKPESMKIKLLKQPNGLYYQTLVWIWWNQLPNGIFPFHLSELEIPEGIHAVCLMAGPESKSMSKGDVSTDVYVLKLPDSVRQVDFTNLNVREEIKISSENPWLHLSSDGKKLLDQEENEIGALYNGVEEVQRIALYVDDHAGGWRKLTTVLLEKGMSYPLLNAIQFLKLPNKRIFVGWKEGSPDADFCTEDVIRVSHIGEERAFYGVTEKLPVYMRSKNYFKTVGGFPEYHQTLEWIKWDQCEDKLEMFHLKELDVPEGIYELRFMPSYDAAEFSKGATTQVDTLKLSSTVRSVDFTNLSVNDRFIVSDKNRWLKTSDDGKTLLDTAGNVLGYVQNQETPKQKIVFKFRKGNGAWQEGRTIWLQKGMTYPLLGAYRWAPLANGGINYDYINGKAGLGEVIFRGFKEESTDAEYYTEQYITYDKLGTERVFYGELAPRPRYLKVVMRKQSTEEYYQTLEWIWWGEYQKTVDAGKYKFGHMDELIVPEGIHVIAIRGGAGDQSMSKGTLTEVGLLSIPSTVRKIDFTNLVVLEKFVVDPENPWFHASEDGTELLDQEGKVIGKVSPKEQHVETAAETAAASASNIPLESRIVASTSNIPQESKILGEFRLEGKSLLDLLIPEETEEETVEAPTESASEPESREETESSSEAESILETESDSEPESSEVPETVWEEEPESDPVSESDPEAENIAELESSEE